MRDVLNEVEPDWGTQAELIRRAINPQRVATSVRRKTALLGFVACMQSATMVPDVLTCPDSPFVVNRSADVVLVGNGPVRGFHGERIDRADIVVRFNEPVRDEPARFGHRTDVLFVNDHAFDPKVDIARQVVLSSCDDLQFNEANQRCNRTTTVRNELLRPICETWNPSRGFLAVALLLTSYDRVNILGFGGVGHHRPGWVDLTYHMGYHDVEAEHQAMASTPRVVRIVDE